MPRHRTVSLAVLRIFLKKSKKAVDKRKKLWYNNARRRARRWCGSMAEQLICNQQVDGSTPFTSSKSLRSFLCVSILGSVPEWPKGTDCKSAASRFGGPNPPAPTKSTCNRKCFFSAFRRNGLCKQKKITKNLHGVLHFRKRYDRILLNRGYSSVGRAIRSQRIGHEFESRYLHQRQVAASEYRMQCNLCLSTFHEDVVLLSTNTSKAAVPAPDHS